MTADAVLVVQGHEAAGVVAALAAAEVPAPDGPYPVAKGWWSLNVGGRASALLERSGPMTGVGIEAGGAPGALVTLKDIDGITTFLAGVQKVRGDAARLAAWSAHAPRTISKRTAERLLFEVIGVEGREISARLLRRLGFGAIRRGEPWEELDGAISAANWDSPSFLGTARFDVRAQRWRFARLPEGYGLWDFDGPAHPIEQWPTPEQAVEIDKTVTGWLLPYERRARRRWYELVARPILERTVLDGARAWGQLDREHEGVRHSYRFVLHRSEAGVVSEFDVRPPNHTHWWMDGRILVFRNDAQRHGVEGPADPDEPWMIEVPNRDFDDAKAAFKLRQPPERNLVLIDIPDVVSRHFLDTCEYVRAATHPRYLPLEAATDW